MSDPEPTATQQTNGRMPATTDIPEIPDHRLLITDDDGWDERWVTDSHDDVRIPGFQYVIVQCGICGETSSDSSPYSAEMHAEMSHEVHFEHRHIGTKVVWGPESFPGSPDDLARSPTLRESTIRDDADEWRSWAAKLRGDCPDDKAVEIAAERLDDPPEAFLVEHHPPAIAYPGSDERQGLPSMRFVEVPESDD